MVHLQISFTCALLHCWPQTFKTGWDATNISWWHQCVVYVIFANKKETLITALARSTARWWTFSWLRLPEKFRLSGLGTTVAVCTLETELVFSASSSFFVTLAVPVSATGDLPRWIWKYFESCAPTYRIYIFNITEAPPLNYNLDWEKMQWW